MFWVRQPGDAAQRAPTLLYFHGNAGNIGHRWNICQILDFETNSSFRLQNVKGLYSALGCNVALLEYRGYGRSEGSPSEVIKHSHGILFICTCYYCIKCAFIFNLSQEGLCMDAQAALDYLHTREDIASDRWL